MFIRLWFNPTETSPPSRDLWTLLKKGVRSKFRTFHKVKSYVSKGCWVNIFKPNAVSGWSNVYTSKICFREYYPQYIHLKARHSVKKHIFCRMNRIKKFFTNITLCNLYPSKIAKFWENNRSSALLIMAKYVFANIIPYTSIQNYKVLFKTTEN